MGRSLDAQLDRLYARARAKADRVLQDNRLAIVGFGFYELFDQHGHIKQEGVFANLITQVGDQYYGDRAAGILGSAVAITAISNAANAVVTAAGHGLGLNDPVTIAGVTPSGYNGEWAIHAVTSTTYTIYVGTALGAGSAFGTGQGLTLPQGTGMRLGTGVTAVAKTGAGAAIVTYTTGSNLAFDATFPSSSLSGSSRQIQFKTTWGAGVATANSLSEVVITNESPISDVAGTAANTLSRALLSPVVNKGSLDSLAVTWNHQLLGA